MAVSQSIRSSRTLPESDPTAVAKWIGREYVESDELPGAERILRSAYSEIATVVGELYDDIPIQVVFQSEDPYSDYRDMRATVGAEGVLRVYDEHTDQFLSEREQLEFRAVHDWHGHLYYDVDFSPEGEFLKWYNMTEDYDFSHMTKRVLFAEVVGQTGAVHYLQGGFASDRYEQRACIAPISWVDAMWYAVDP